MVKSIYPERRRKILVIDDETHIADGFKVILEASGSFDVATAYSGADGVSKAKQQNFALVITDFHMPGMDGEDVLDALKGMDPQIPVLVFSIYHDDDSEINSRIRGKADAILEKPINNEQLQQTIERFIGG